MSTAAETDWYGRVDVVDSDLAEAVRAEAGAAGLPERRAQRVAELIRIRTRRRWVGIYRVEGDEVANLAWSGPAPSAHPRFPIDRGLTGAAIESGRSVLSNDVANDPRYLTALGSTGSELIVPVLVDGRVVGTLDVEDERTDAFDEDDRVLFEQLAEMLRGLYR